MRTQRLLCRALVVGRDGLYCALAVHLRLLEERLPFIGRARRDRSPPPTHYLDERSFFPFYTSLTKPHLRPGILMELNRLLSFHTWFDPIVAKARPILPPGYSLDNHLALQLRDRMIRELPICARVNGNRNPPLLSAPLLSLITDSCRSPPGRADCLDDLSAYRRHISYMKSFYEEPSSPSTRRDTPRPALNVFLPDTFEDLVVARAREAMGSPSSPSQLIADDLQEKRDLAAARESVYLMTRMEDAYQRGQRDHAQGQQAPTAATTGPLRATPRCAVAPLQPPRRGCGRGARTAAARRCLSTAMSAASAADALVTLCSTGDAALAQPAPPGEKPPHSPPVVALLPGAALLDALDPPGTDDDDADSDAVVVAADADDVADITDVAVAADAADVADLNDVADVEEDDQDPIDPVFLNTEMER